VTAEENLRVLGLALPQLGAPAGLYSPCVWTGSSVYVSGQIPRRPDGSGVAVQGRVGAGVTVEEAASLARTCALQALAIVRAEVGSLDRVVAVPRVAGYVAGAPGFTDHPSVVNGASEVLLEVFGRLGRHARIAIGVAELPLGAPVEVEFLFEVV